MEGNFTAPPKDQNKIKIFDISDCKPCLTWLRSSISNNVNPDERVSFPYKTASNRNLFKLIEYSIPPIFNPKFFNLKIDNYKKEFDNNSGIKFLSIATGLMFINQEFGYQLLDNIKNDEFIDDCGIIGYASSAVDNFIHVLCNAFHGGEKTSPSQDDLCGKSSHFLLEPSVLIQLPWKPVLFHQWLTVALSEVLIFEKDSMEIRHWSMDKDAVTIATNLLSLVTNLKERILLGFAILNEATDNFTKTSEKLERKYMESILDNVLIPSLPVLQFLTSGLAKICKENIKCNTNSSIGYYVPQDAYKIEDILDHFSFNFAYNFPIWILRDIANMFPLLTEKVGAIAHKLINKNKVTKPIILSSEQFKPMSLSEVKLLELAQNNFHKLSHDNVVKITVRIIQNNVIKKDKILGVSLEQVEEKFMSEEIKFDAIFNDTKSEVCLAIKQTLIYYEIKKLLKGWNKNSSIANQLISLQLEALEEEQLARLSNTCAVMFKTHTVSKKTSNFVLENVSVKIQEVFDQIKKSKRKSFWLKFDQSWKEKVNPDEEFVALKSLQNLDICIQQMLNRVGRIIFNHSYDFFNSSYKFKNNFEEINFVHYLLPYIIYFYADKYKNNTKNIIHYDFIKEWIRIYEINYMQSYKKEIKRCKNSNNDETQKVAVPTYDTKHCRDLLTVSSALKKCIEIPLRLAAEQKNSFDFLHQILDFFIHIKDWYPSIFRKDRTNFCPQIVPIFHDSAKYYYSIMIHIHKSLLKSFKIPEIICSSDLFPRIPKLNDLYFAASVIFDISCVYETANLPQFEIPELQKHEYDYTMLKCYLNKATVDIVEQVIIKSKTSPLHGRGDYIDFNFIQEKTVALYEIYSYFVLYTKQLGIPKFTALPFLPYSCTNPEVKSAVHIFLNRNYAAFIDKIKIFSNREVLEALVSPKEYTVCRRCGKIEDKEVDKFLTCIKCVENNYPQINYFCSKICEKEIWKAEHMAEHLEYDLGLLQLSAIL